MKKRLASIILSILLIILQLFSAGNAVFAEGELEVTAEVVGAARINNMPYVPLMGPYSIKYDIKNTSQSEIRIIEMSEKSPNGKKAPVDLKGNTSLGAGESMSLTGNIFYGDLNSNPNAVEYTIKYAVTQGEQEQEFPLTGHTIIHVIDANFKVTYTTQARSPVFKGEQVKLQVVLESVSNVTLYNITITDTDLGEEIGTIDVLAPGGKATVEKTAAIENSTMGNLDINYDDPMGIASRLQKHVNTDLEIQVRDEDPVSSLELGGKAGKTKIPGPTEVEFELTVRNTGNTVLRELKFLDWDGKEFHTYDTLNPGEELVLKHTGTIKPDTEYELMVQARVENSNQLIKSVWSVKLEKLNPQVEIQREVSADSIKAGEPFVLNYIVKNTGNVDLIDVRIEESAFGEITRLDSIPAGQEAEFSKELVLEENVLSKTILTARDAETEKDYSYESSMMEFTVEESGEEGPKQDMSILLVSKQESLSRPGTVELECIIKNTGREPLFNLVLTLVERDMVIDNISELKPGEDKTITIPSFRIEKTETFTVEANGFGADQQKFTAKSKPLTIEVAESGLSGKFSVLRVVLIIIILLCVLVIGVLVYTLRDSFRLPFRRKRRNSINNR